MYKFDYNYFKLNSLRIICALQVWLSVDITRYSEDIPEF